METIKTYKCPCCGAPLIYDGQSQELKCNSCGNNFPLKSMEQLENAENKVSGDSHYDWAHYTPRKFEPVGETNLSGYVCPSCGAEITGDATMGSTICPYCGNGNIIQEQFKGTLEPDYIIPFKISKKSAMEAFEEDSKKATFLPNLFKSRKKIEEMSGLYVPFWTFDCKCNADFIYRGEMVMTWSDSDYNYTKTDYYKLFRSGTVEFANIPVDGSQKIDNVYTEAVEPYNYDDAVKFDEAYLSGYLADKYDVPAEECEGRANERVKNSTQSIFRETTSTYTGVHEENSSMSFSDGKIRYALLPVWMLNIKYENKLYKFAINGQTGKVIGEYPIDKKKKWMFFAKAAGISYAIAAVIAWFLLS